jgi:hypothetical protein
VKVSGLSALLERARDAHADERFLAVLEHDRLVERRQRRDAIDRPRVGPAAEREGRHLLQQLRIAGRHPGHFHGERSLVGAALRLDDPAVIDRAHLRRVFGLDRIRVVPEVEAVHVAMVEPQADVVRMIHPLARPRIERKPARDERPFAVRMGEDEASSASTAR